MSKTVLLTGARGFIGSHLSEALAQRPAWRLVVSARPGRAAAGEIAVALDDPRAVGQLIETVRPDHVIHAAGRARGAAAEIYRDDVLTAVALSDAILAQAPNAILTVLGSAAEYGVPRDDRQIKEDYQGAPVSAYGCAKQATAKYLDFAATRGLKRNLVRVFNPVAAVNPPALVLGAFITRAEQALAGPPPHRVEMGYLGHTRDFVAMQDLERLVINLVARDAHDCVVNACTGRGLTPRALVQEINRLAGGRLEIVEAPDAGTGGGAVVGDPTRFLEMADLARPTPIEQVLAEAWRISGGRKRA